MMKMNANEPIRNRIVINLDSPAGSRSAHGRIPGGRTRRWPRVLAILAVLVLVVVAVTAIGGYLWWRHYQTTPAYSLTLIIDAAQRNDMPEFEKRIDDDAIARNMIASVSQNAADRYGFALSDSLQQRIDKLLPSLLPRLNRTIHEEVAKEIREVAAKSEPRPFIVLALAVPGFVTITTEGETARASAPIHNRTIELTLRRDAERWKVTEYKDDVVVQRVVDSMMKELPAIGSSDLNIPLLKTPGRKSKSSRR